MLAGHVDAAKLFLIPWTARMAHAPVSHRIVPTSSLDALMTREAMGHWSHNGTNGGDGKGGNAGHGRRKKTPRARWMDRLKK